MSVNKDIPSTSSKFGQNNEELGRTSPTWKAPNSFVALQISNSEILEKLKSVQDEVVSKDPNLATTCVALTKSHLTLAVFYMENQQISEVKSILEKVVSDFRISDDDSINISVEGLGNFNNRVLFGKIKFSSTEIEERFLLLWKTVVEKLYQAGFMKTKDTTVDANKIHSTVMKLSEYRKRRKDEVRPKIIPTELYADKIDEKFGQDILTKVQLLSMTEPKDPKTGYYYCHKEFSLQTPLEGQEIQLPSFLAR